MSDNTRSEETISIAEDRLSVEKSFTNSEFPVPAVSFRIRSDREEPVRVRVIDEIPESFPMERIGFHPEFEGDNWTAYENHTVEYERVIDPDADGVHTVYGIRAEDPDVDAFLTTPSVTQALLDEEIESVIGADDSEAVREVIAGDRDTLLGIDETEDETADTDSVSADSLPEETAAESHDQGEDSSATPEPQASSDDPDQAATGFGDNTTANTADEDAHSVFDTPDRVSVPSAEDPPAGGTSGVDDDGVAASLADEIRNGTVDDDDLALLAENLELVDNESVNVQIDHIQSQLADLEAYTSALEEFLNEEGTAQQVFRELQNELNRMSNNVADLSARVDHAESNRQEIAEVAEQAQSTANSIDDRVTELASSVDDTVENVTDLTGQVQDATDDIDSVDSELGEVRDELADFDAQVTSIEDEFEDRLETESEELEERLETETAEFEDSLDEVTDELADISERLEEFEEFRESLSDAFGN